jgi:group II intron reverse transcriptase/maturase
MRPLGIACIEDKIVQLMFAKVLEAIYEPSFLGCSFGFRPKRNCHQMIAGVHSYLFGQWRPVVIDVDLENFFGTIDHAKLLKLPRLRIEDETFLRYIARMLKSGVLSGDSLRTSEDGTPQGSVCSPVLANIFAHYAVDVWVEHTVRKHCPSARLFRYCDDFVICCANLLEANRVMAVLPKRLERFSLKLNQTKSKLVVMDKAAAGRGNRQGTFDLLGFTFYLGRNRKGTYVPKLQTSRKRFRSKLKEINQWVRIHRHQIRMPDLWRQLQVKIRGHIEYYGVSHNTIFLSRFSLRARMIFFKWINRRSQKRSVTWEQFTMFMKRHPEAKVSISHRLF